MSALALSVLLSLVSAVAYAGGAILQEQVAVSSPGGQYAPLRRPAWWTAVTLNGLGALLHVVALAYGPLSLVQPLGALTIVFALPMAALFVRRRAGAAAWRGAIMATVGLAGLLSLVGAADAQSLSTPQRVGTALVTVGAVAALMAAGRAAHRHPAVRSVLLATASGIAFGMASVFTKTVAVDWTGGVAASDLPSLAVIAVFAVGGVLLSQAAYRGGGLAAPLATLTVVNPVVAAAIGITMFGETFRYGTTGTALALASGVVAAGGLILLTTERLHGAPEAAVPEGVPGAQAGGAAGAGRRAGIAGGVPGAEAGGAAGAGRGTGTAGGVPEPVAGGAHSPDGFRAAGGPVDGVPAGGPGGGVPAGGAWDGGRRGVVVPKQQPGPGHGGGAVVVPGPGIEELAPLGLDADLALALGYGVPGPPETAAPPGRGPGPDGVTEPAGVRAAGPAEGVVRPSAAAFPATAPGPPPVPREPGPADAAYAPPGPVPGPGGEPEPAVAGVGAATPAASVTHVGATHAAGAVGTAGIRDADGPGGPGGPDGPRPDAPDGPRPARGFRLATLNFGTCYGGVYIPPMILDRHRSRVRS
jgi:hypothetical protein